MSDNCPRCRDQYGHDPVGDAQCALRFALAARLADYAATLDRPPKPRQVADLAAHLLVSEHTIGAAHAAAQRVLDLGWRPVIGSDL